MRSLWKISLLGVAVALPVSALVPVSVPACPMSAAKAAPCCCCTAERSAGTSCPCPAPSRKPAGGAPGSPCVLQKTLPIGTLPSATAEVVDGSFFSLALPATLLFPVTPSAAPILHSRIEPGWDPGSIGFIVPLRL